MKQALILCIVGTALLPDTFALQAKNREEEAGTDAPSPWPSAASRASRG